MPTSTCSASSTLPGGLTERYDYTPYGQRTSTPYEAFVYDDLGNHLTQNDNGTEIAGLFNAVNEQTKRGGADVLYDKKGNLTKDDDGQVYFYDRQNLLSAGRLNWFFRNLGESSAKGLPCAGTNPSDGSKNELSIPDEHRSLDVFTKSAEEPLNSVLPQSW